MQVKYYPKYDADGRKLREFAVAVLLPDKYDRAVKWGWGMFIHGIGERSAGSEPQLENLVIGSMQPDGTRKWPFVTDGMRTAVDKYGIVMCIPTYENFFEPASINTIYNFVMSEYALVPKMMQPGFSLGGGAVLKYITSSLENANRVAYAIPCAPTMNLMDASIPGKVNMPVHLFVNTNDPNGATNINVTKSAVNSINNSNPNIRALYTAFNESGHGGFDRATRDEPPKAPGGQGFIDGAETIYQVYKDIIANGSRQMKSGAVITPTPPIEPPTEIKPITSYTIDSQGIHLRGDQSIGYQTGADGGWDYLSGPATKAQVFPRGSTYINADGILPAPGTYKFQFTLKGAAPVDVIVNYSGGVRTAVAFNSVTDLITYSDGSTEKGEAVFSNGKWTVKNLSGQIIVL